MSEINWHRVPTLPAVLEPGSFYYVENGNYAEAYLTDLSGVAKSIGNTSMINALVAQALANWSGGSSTVEIVPDIAARDALILTLEANAMILVVDATDDPTVDLGSALYAYDFTSETTYKIAEYESMDIVLEWSAIVGGPTSSPAQIDNAVSIAHTHANKAVLDKFTEEGGLPRYAGKPIQSEWATESW